MKVTLTFEYDIKEEDGCGTSNDAIVTAVKALEKALDLADSTDDLSDVFSKILFDGEEL